MEYQTTHRDDIPLSTDEVEGPDAQIVQGILGMEELSVKFWHFHSGEEIPYHAERVEEFYFVLQGEFSLKLGESGDTEIITVGPGDCWAAGPKIGHGHRNIGDGDGIILAVSRADPKNEAFDPHQL